jgi:hypothetical protein
MEKGAPSLVNLNSQLPVLKAEFVAKFEKSYYAEFKNFLNDYDKVQVMNNFLDDQEVIKNIEQEAFERARDSSPKVLILDLFENPFLMFENEMHRREVAFVCWTKGFDTLIAMRFAHSDFDDFEKQFEERRRNKTLGLTELFESMLAGIVFFCIEGKSGDSVRFESYVMRCDQELHALTPERLEDITKQASEFNDFLRDPDSSSGLCPRLFSALERMQQELLWWKHPFRHFFDNEDNSSIQSRYRGDCNGGVQSINRRPVLFRGGEFEESQGFVATTTSQSVAIGFAKSSATENHAPVMYILLVDDDVNVMCVKKMTRGRQSLECFEECEFVIAPGAVFQDVAEEEKEEARNALSLADDDLVRVQLRVMTVRS